MGHLSFLTPRREHAGQEAAQRAYMVGMDELPWRTRVSWTTEGLSADRSEHESGALVIPWQVAGHGHLALATATLVERTEPYHLTVELLRGTLHRLRSHLAAWETAGLIASPAVQHHLRTALQLLAEASLTQGRSALAADESAQSGLEAACTAGRRLLDDYIEQSLAARRRGTAKLPTVLGVALPQQGPLHSTAAVWPAACNMAPAALWWREAEPTQGQFDWTRGDERLAWCAQHGMKPFVGPLIQLTPSAAPDWLSLWEGDFEHLFSFVTTFVESAVERYRGKAALWHAAASLNTSAMLDLGEEQQLRLAAHILEVVRKADPHAPVIVSFDQPWAEYMARKDCDLSPLHFADALVRAGLGLGGVGIELRFGFESDEALPRDWLEISRQLDRWTLLGVPLVAMVSLPDFAALGIAGNDREAWVRRLMGLLLAKPAVQGVFWEDAEARRPRKQAGPVSQIALLELCTAVRQEYLN